MIPVRHAATAASLAPHARIEVIEDAGHFPHKDHPERFAGLLADFVATTQPARYSRAAWRRLMRLGPDAVPPRLSSLGDTA